jgi:hypothetical protein
VLTLKSNELNGVETTRLRFSIEILNSPEIRWREPLCRQDVLERPGRQVGRQVVGKRLTLFV